MRWNCGEATVFLAPLTSSIPQSCTSLIQPRPSFPSPQMSTVFRVFFRAWRLDSPRFGIRVGRYSLPDLSGPHVEPCFAARSATDPEHGRGEFGVSFSRVDAMTDPHRGTNGNHTVENSCIVLRELAALPAASLCGNNERQGQGHACDRALPRSPHATVSPRDHHQPHRCI